MRKQAKVRQPIKRAEILDLFLRAAQIMRQEKAMNNPKE